MEYGGFTGQPAFTDADSRRNNQLQYSNMTHHHQHHFKNATPASSESLNQSAYYPTTNPQSHPISCDIKPRLTKEQHDILEAQFQKQNKPNTNTKKSFAENLNVPLEKINNWFQNRRAKSKQDAKKQAGALNLYNTQHQTQSQQADHTSFSSDSDTSPAFPANDYYSMMQQCAPSDHSLDVKPSLPESSQQPAFSVQDEFSTDAVHYQAFGQPQHLSVNMFDTPQELQRRTLTQEQFDAFSHNVSTYDPFQHGVSTENGMMHQMFPGLPNGEVKQLPNFDFPVPQSGSSVSGANSSVPSTIADMSAFMSLNVWDESNMSVPNSDWTGSRSSSVSITQPDEQYTRMPIAHQEPMTTNSQWRPGQSVPVDFDALSQEFRQAAQSRQPSHMQPQIQEQALAWPEDEEAFLRRDSSASMLAQQMSSVGINTPQQQQSATFKAPPPPSSIAARRQRPRPAALGIASLRSQSYSGSTQSASPGHAQQVGSAPAQTLRRIRSSNVINGVAQGRVQKQLPGSAQRSPLAWTFADSIASPKAVRHASASSGSSNLAPPTPLSPHGGPQWQSGDRHPSISESDMENSGFFDSVPTKDNFSSPPHTPMYHQIAQQHLSNNVINENTPPQSAPASQSCFPSSVYSQSHSQLQQVSQPQEYTTGVVSDMFPMANMSYAPNQRFTAPTTTASAEVPIQFANGVPMVNAQGQLTLGFPTQAHFVAQPAPQQPAASVQGKFGQFSIARTPPALPATSQPSKPSSVSSGSSTELHVHEYDPPADVKRAAVPRKPEATSPKNYTFANHGPEHFEKGKRSASTATNSSPGSNSSG